MAGKGVDNPCMAHKRHPLGRIREVSVYMTMDKITRFKTADKFDETVESPVTAVFGIVNMPRRRMGDNNIHTAPEPQPWNQAPDHLAHLVFPVLDRAAVVPTRPLQPYDPEAFECDPPLVDVHATHRRRGFVTDIMVATHIKQRRIQPLTDG